MKSVSKHLYFWLAILCLVACSQDRPGDTKGPSEPQSGIELLQTEPDDRFDRADRVIAFEFPQDHGVHQNFQTEWWYLTGNLATPEGREFGYQFTIFRFGADPEVPVTGDKWQAGHLFLAQAAVSDLQAETFVAAEATARGAMGLAGALQDDLNVHVYDWRLQRHDDVWLLSMDAENLGFALELRPEKPPVLNGNDGLSQKSSMPGNASYYYSVTRLATTGTITVGGASYAVSGSSWFDREWSTSALDPDQAGWDWLALHLTDGRDLMIYRLRTNQNMTDPSSGGTLTSADGQAIQLTANDFSWHVSNTWMDPKDGSVFPTGWEIQLPEHGLDLRVNAAFADQRHRGTFDYWEGAVRAFNGPGDELVAKGYMEMTGYGAGGQTPDNP